MRADTNTGETAMSMTVAALTPDELQTLLDDGHEYELVDGEAVRLNMSLESSWIAGEILHLLRLAMRRRGWVYPVDAGFQCFADDPQMVRKPDVALILRERQPHGPSPEGYCRIAPDLVVEVVSPNDVARDVHDKIELWLRAGVQQVWVVWPSTRTVEVHTEAEITRLKGRDELTAGALIPDFRCAVADLFPQV